uniref:Uncharacterized protein n=1 Tax=Anguilla anguilla TaxID=7936 RepID=A0A0E9RIP5_ANGAN
MCNNLSINFKMPTTHFTC